jgi:hypothetical protein
MDSIKKFLSGNKVTDDEPDVEERIRYKIRAFNSITKILADTQQGPPFQDLIIPDKTPPSKSEKVHLRLSNAFALLAVVNTDVVAATWYIPGTLSVMAWQQDQNSDDLADDQDKPSQDSGSPKPNWVWHKICWLFATNTKNADLRPGSGYPGPCVVKPMPPADYPAGSDPKVNLLPYLDEFYKKW